MLSDEEMKAIERAEFLIKIDTYLEKEMLINLLNLLLLHVLKIAKKQ